MFITNDIKYVGVNDHEIDLFEGQFTVPNGMAYNSYVITDEKTAVMDTVDARFTAEWLGNIESVLGGRKPDYLVVQHMEPDHSANIVNFLTAYPEATVIANSKTLTMMKNFFDYDFDGKVQLVEDGSSISLGRHELTFVFAPMVHWPEVMFTYDKADKVLFTADGFGKFGALDVDEEWDCEARRYYFGIVGKYGAQVQSVLKKAAALDINIICPLHGPVWRKDLGWFIEKYDTWSRYAPETQGVLIVYASMYGNTENAAQALATSLCDKGMSKVAMYDVSSTHVSQLISEAFKYSHIVLASVTYNLGIYPAMHDFLMDMKALNLQNRTFAIIENGSWAVKSGDLMQKFVNDELKNMTVLNERLSLASSMGTDKRTELEALADAILESMK